MNEKHPSEETLQQFVLERAACPAEEISHIERCPECLAVVAAYSALVNELSSQAVPTFDFDLAAAVIGKLEKAAVPPAKTPKLTMVLIAIFIVVPLWLFRRSAYFVFTDMPAVFYWLVLAAAAIVVGLFVLRLYKKYQQVINLINE